MAFVFLAFCHKQLYYPFNVLNWEHIVTAQCDGPPRVAWRALEILVIFTTAFKREGTCPMKVKQSLAWYVLIWITKYEARTF